MEPVEPVSEEEWISRQILELEQQDLTRGLQVFEHGLTADRTSAQVINFSSNDYLNYRNNPKVIDALSFAAASYGVGTGASRLVSGTTQEHMLLEQELSSWLGKAALVFGSGYLANLGLLTTIATRNTTILLDRLAHATLLDGAILSRATVKRFRHNDLSHVTQLLRAERAHDPARRILIVTESVFSMDGDRAPLEELLTCADEFRAELVVDEAHALGVFGRGLAYELGLEQRIAYLTGTFSKSFGTYGGFVAGSPALRELLISASRAFKYDTALPAPLCASVREVLRLMQSEPKKGEDVLEQAQFFRSCLSQHGIEAPGDTQIVPVLVGESNVALELAGKLREHGVLVVAIRPPTVPGGTARIRFSVTAAHSKAVLERAAEVIASTMSEAGMLSVLETTT